jgi:hypothetical protein
MPLYHEVRRGESLWSLARQQLGSGTRWPEIYDFHNKEAAKFGSHRRLMPIANENLIYVGQTIVLPPRQKNPAPGNGTLIEGKKQSIPLDLKVSYTIGRDTPPMQYIRPYIEFTIKTEVSGEIGLEIITDYKRRHSIELLMSKDPMQTKQKLHEAYDPALCALMAKPEMIFESGKVKIKAPIATEAKMGPYTINMQADAPNHMSGTLKPPTINGTANVKGTNYKFNANLELKAEVIWHPNPKGGPASEPVRVAEIQREKVVRESSNNSIDWSKAVDYADEFVAVVTITILTIFAPAIRMSMTGTGATTSFMPFHYSIDPRRYGYPLEA